ncbi:UDP-N-acetylmuramate--L-alanine ligase [Arthrobacter zhangbolii]|uniref:UDP-N-acetylmuramate--L-alanine ligase n=1 Tax=Arthrobacter zhangbolii TaxID=2886936 RepID=A0A9X1S954_9MICC|nr:UDP-N-acetylmuramate--L-alanine ligase [Arthrobacter zhangbolii]MCC3271902.1 UDP-N-acetylmuramate--L-alanine ligase [Arthrobacter zhangbolii]UON93279.1 UDP-N-acetylmuramate--L-alanine ligase [Arthrobacter zhangbolii]
MISRLNPSELGRVHFIGLGGAGMSAVARVLLAQGIPVSGSDAKDSPGLRALGALGARTFVGHDAAHVAEADTVVVSTAIREQNPELAEARRLGLRVIHRSVALSAAMGDKDLVAVAGTHGKTTTTAMVTVMLREAGLDPSFAIGGDVAALGVNAASGSGPVFVAEADESDGSFLNYTPQIIVVTNVEADHLDHYGTEDAVFAAFDAFTSLLPSDGLLVACADDAGAAALLRRNEGVRAATYGYAENADIRISDTSPQGSGSSSTLTYTADGQASQVRLDLQVPGAHNILNAAAAFAVALELGVDPNVAAAGLGTFSGAARRFESRGASRGVRVYDDYAHHPTEVNAALKAARTVADGHRVHVLFQPHLFSRTRNFAAEFAQALDLADTATVLDIYPAREDPIEGVTSELITSRLSVPGGYVEDPQAAVERVADGARDGDVILTVGAGDVTRLGADLVARLAARNGGDAADATAGKTPDGR